MISHINILFQSFWTTMYEHYGQNERRKPRRNNRSVDLKFISLGYSLQPVNICLRKSDVWCCSAHMLEKIYEKEIIQQLGNWHQIFFKVRTKKTYNSIANILTSNEGILRQGYEGNGLVLGNTSTLQVPSTRSLAP